MTTHPRTSFALLTCFTVVVAFYLVGVQPAPLVVAEAFPAGLIAGAWLFVPRRRQLLYFVCAWVVSTGIYLACGRDLFVALGWALAAVVGSAIVAHGITQGPERRAALLTDVDLRRFIAQTFLGSLVAAGIAGAVASVSGHTQWWVAALGVGLAHFATYLVLLPHFLGRPRFPGVASRLERVIQWVVTVSLTVVAFLPLDLGPSIAFGVIPCLGWSALRAPMRETLVQLLVVATASHAMTMQGLGPFAVDPGSSVLRAEMLTILFALWVIACGLTTIPFSLAVGVQRREAWQSRQEQARVRQLVQSATSVAIIGTDAHGHIDLFNPGAELIFGYTSHEVLGLTPSIFLTRAEIERVAQVLGTRSTFVDVAYALASSENESLDLDFLRKDGSVVTLQFSISRIFNDDGKVIGYVTTGEDVTSRVKRQLALEEALAHERLAVENLKEVDQVKDALVSGVSHELRTPITSILGYLEMLEDGGFGPLAEGQAKALGRVKGNSNRLLSLIDDLLMLSRIQDGYLAVESTRIDLRDVVASARDEMAPVLTASGLTFDVELPEQPVAVVGDAERLGRVLVNLLSNAMKFTDRFGAVTVRLAVEGADAVVSVSDTGIGIPEGEQDHLFERFFRATSARERAIQGSGLGLAIARALVQSHGGGIEVQSQVDVGSTFVIRLPLEEALSVIEQAPGPPQEQETAGAPAGR
ncbi:sensor histidine kinase [Nocardioides jishulii]|uniref:histidine kinase n=1 Tax=Nocardioides jishulii TaxID=2575440 RepID=A0A4V5TJX3_9ACTN|nr:HAMP domain-containing sensor histidine kinase [Nocardioides jishulii]QCX26870.1 PAS domain S-box protein [Nocardioides jishulii]TKI61353.1 PAS domain S-box protein [Nocardioides jishulii]